MSLLAVRLKGVCQGPATEGGTDGGRGGGMGGGMGKRGREVVTNEEVERGALTERSVFVLTDNVAC